jgi:hypothetical protein
VFVEPTVTPCGHTFCAFCIGEWTANERRQNCPMCRKGIDPLVHPQRHVQMENFVGKMYAFLSGHALSVRATLIADRTKAAAAQATLIAERAEAEAARAALIAERVQEVRSRRANGVTGVTTSYALQALASGGWGEGDREAAEFI